MGIIKRNIEVIGTRRTKEIEELFDSGAIRTYLRKEFFDGDRAEELGFNTYEGIQRVILADQTITRGIKVRFEGIKIEGCLRRRPEIIILDNLLADAIVGCSLMEELGVILNFRNDALQL